MIRSSRLFAAAFGLAILLPASAAQAFCRTSSCGDKGTGAVCTAAQPGDCGIALFWANPCVGYSIQKAGSAKISFTDTEEVMHQAFAAWTGAMCSGGGTPRMAVKELAAAECAKHEYNQDKGNDNIVLYHDDKWPYEGSGNTLALTTVTYNLDTGEIYDADLELNSADNPLTLGDAGVQFDLLSIVTHEAGHFLGLAHTNVSDATMYPDYKQGDTSLRTLQTDDVDGICTVYPPGDAIPSSCDTTPRHGFSTLCAADQTGTTSTDSGGCCMVAPTSGSSNLGALAAAGAFVLAARRRSQRRSGLVERERERTAPAGRGPRA